MRKIIALTLGIMMACTFMLFGCGGTDNADSQKDKTVIEVMDFDGGVRSVWLENAAKRFEQKVKDVSYEDGKTGVYVKISKAMSPSLAALNTSAYNIYFRENIDSLRNYIAKGDFLDITDIVTEKETETRDGKPISIEDKIPDFKRESLSDSNGRYYALPHYTYYPGLSYDIEVFDQYNLYFAAEGETDSVAYEGKYAPAGKYNFVASKDAARTCGPDGLPKTDDDGLPSSLEQFLVLCDMMKSSGIEPIALSGAYINYSNYFMSGLWAALAGYDQTRACFTFDGDIEIVDGFTGENLFYGVDYIKAPVLKTVKVTEETGYLTWDMSARYYAVSLLEVIEKEGFFHTGSYNSNVTHTDIQNMFITGNDSGQPTGMLIEATYWYNESDVAGNFSKFHRLYDRTRSLNGLPEEKQIGWMALPTSLNTMTTEGNGETVAIVDTASAYAFINANIQKMGKTGLVNACKDFLRHCYTDYELSAFTATTGCHRGLDYDIEDEHYSSMNSFYKQVWNARNKDKSVIYCDADNETFLSGRGTFRFTLWHPALHPKVGNTQYNNYLGAIRKSNSTSVELFEMTRLTADDWISLYKGK